MQFENRSKPSQRGEAVYAILLVLVGAAAWFTHLYTCFTEERWGFLIAGALFFPVAIIHGIGLWFGFW
jgi:hypothetical protein